MGLSVTFQNSRQSSIHSLIYTVIGRVVVSRGTKIKFQEMRNLSEDIIYNITSTNGSYLLWYSVFAHNVSGKGKGNLIKFFTSNWNSYQESSY